MLVSIIAFIIVLLFLVVVHEFGHFILARKAGVTVHEFSIGMGPKVWSFGKDKKWTEFIFRLLPLGWYVRIKWESPAEDGALTQSDSFLRASFLWKVAILLGGVTMNIITAWVIFTLWFWHGIKPIQVLPNNVMVTQSQSYLMPSYSFLQDQWLLEGDEHTQPAKILQVAPQSLASQIWLMSWDVIITLNNIRVSNMNLQAELQNNIGKEITLTYDRGGSTGEMKTVCPTDSCVLWVMLDVKDTITIKPIKFWLVESMWKAVHEMNEQSRLTFWWLAWVVKNLTSSKDRSKTVNKLSWPIWAAKVWQYVLASGGWLQFLMFGGLLSMALAIFNLLPIPALDGGRLLGVIIQKIFNLKTEKYFAIEGWINTVFFIVLLLLWFYIMAHDLVRAWGLHIPGIG